MVTRFEEGIESAEKELTRLVSASYSPDEILDLHRRLRRKEVLVRNSELERARRWLEVCSES